MFASNIWRVIMYSEMADKIQLERDVICEVVHCLPQHEKSRLTVSLFVYVNDVRSVGE